MTATESHLTILASNLTGAVAATALGQPWWFVGAAFVAGTLTSLSFQGSGAIDRGDPGTGPIAAGEFLIAAATIATAIMAAPLIGTIVRLAALVTQMSRIGKLNPPPNAQ